MGEIRLQRKRRHLPGDRRPWIARSLQGAGRQDAKYLPIRLVELADPSKDTECLMQVMRLRFTIGGNGMTTATRWENQQLDCHYGALKRKSKSTLAQAT